MEVRKLPRNILVPTDFGGHAEHALLYAASLGERFGATLHLAHVVTLHGLEAPGQASAFPEVGPLLEAADGSAQARVVTAALRGVNAWEPLLDYAADNEIDLIVLAMHGGAPLARFLLGSITERIVRAAPCPVLVTEKGDRDFLDPETMAVHIDRVVVADNLGHGAIRALDYAAAFLAPYAPEVHLVHAVENEVPTPYLMAGVQSVFTLDPGLRDRLSAVLEAHALRLPRAWGRRLVLEEGRPHKLLPAYAERVQADLLILAGESHIDLAERLVGGTAERILRYAPCPTLII